MISGVVKTKGLPLPAVLVKLCAVASHPGWRRKKTRAYTAMGEGDGGDSMRKERPPCWGPGCSGND